jgi:indolepyruvate ferredoxin oxidoreductase
MNEELGATAVWGSQLAVAQGRASNDGVVGVWYGKGPGVDRSCDVFRHANLYGASATGGALLLAGDDPGAKSSTVPCVTERTLASLSIPVLYPRTAAEVVTMGLYGVALSRESGCWVCPRDHSLDHVQVVSLTTADAGRQRKSRSGRQRGTIKTQRTACT